MPIKPEKDLVSALQSIAYNHTLTLDQVRSIAAIAIGADPSKIRRVKPHDRSKKWFDDL